MTARNALMAAENETGGLAAQVTVKQHREEIARLSEKNAELRNLVIQLSSIVVRNAFSRA